MTTIKATCPCCGDVDLTPRDVTLRVQAPCGPTSYAFTCPGCTDDVVKAADDEVAALLASAGVHISRTHVPAEAREAHSGAALTYDDVLDFALWLERTPDPLAALAVR